MKQTLLGLVLTALFTGAGYGALYLADGRYVRQETWVLESRKQERRQLRKRIAELEWIRENERALSPKESWELKTLESDLQELKR